jgi:hypothetical protein
MAKQDARDRYSSKTVNVWSIVRAHCAVLAVALVLPQAEIGFFGGYLLA